MPTDAGVDVERALEILQDLDEEWDVICDIACKQGEWGWPKCQGDRAEWVGWRVKCCGSGPRYFLLCTYCKETYSRWLSDPTFHLSCAWCGADGGIVTFTELRKT